MRAFALTCAALVVATSAIAASKPGETAATVATSAGKTTTTSSEKPTTMGLPKAPTGGAPPAAPAKSTTDQRVEQLKKAGITLTAGQLGPAVTVDPSRNNSGIAMLTFLYPYTIYGGLRSLGGDVAFLRGKSFQDGTFVVPHVWIGLIRGQSTRVFVDCQVKPETWSFDFEYAPPGASMVNGWQNLQTSVATGGHVYYVVTFDAAVQPTWWSTARLRASASNPDIQVPARNMWYLYGCDVTPMS